MRAVPLVWLAGAALSACSGEGSRTPARCPADMVFIDGGLTTIGFPPPSREWMEPAHRVQLQPYCIDRYEWPNRKGELPQGWLTHSAAQQACASVGKRLCRSDEWERACRGPTGTRYSYGKQRDATACNTPIDGSGPGRGPVPLATSGAYERCVSAEGVYDLNGSLSEWTDTPWTGGPEPFNPDAKVDGSWYTLRGGTMWNRTFYGQDCSSRHGHHASFKNMDDGARCCADAAPL